MRLTREQLCALTQKNPGYTVVAGLSTEEPKPRPRQYPVSHQETGDSSPARVAVIITRCSTGRLDRDNLWAATKAVGDALRYAGYITGDTESDIELIAFQKKVKRADVGTLIEIIPLP